ncbi:50S ribosomal protein L23 [Candidatus Woesebacteria bacterium RIFCSPLOWO2_01_FULL_39_23]|uniref:50S ribosomal protein L23 n=3 Tax=Microgenomates group TaxID=1794810 RepID=A0A0H4TC15_9BACT|nr:50S ribosomal protein L23, large subunit ribosomal protein L23 [uncultured Microgenomates bacterium Rifle_16ft_4_minimus_37633]AKQ05548.1 50S ribosomal protein L23, large subunit ribosomal protein L23 [uncultured Microgenomates bacterium Rifle_16ft_4_minimus_24053]OGM13876.1 MAG: 50S ribosomal protein L23 [Candidatus Woesebacteria bacterium RBG_16_40_11]OGM27828.1 MAG: 50S ribosomal protein L23 [Candidatus Woesebacteria bacterium RIFCSPHIGHO2_01_FULL_40_22]OGM36062.1 MAG: 50S ribosomal prote
MIIQPVLTEKSLEAAKKGDYTFYVEPGLTKYQARELVERVFSVHVTNIRTMIFKREVKRIYTGRKRVIHPKKKIIVTLRAKERIDLFEVKKGK